jgi:hypothetical protein
MKTAVVALTGLVGAGTVAWFFFGRREMQPYPLVAPEQLVSVLPNALKRDIS